MENDALVRAWTVLPSPMKTTIPPPVSGIPSSHRTQVSEARPTGGGAPGLAMGSIGVKKSSLS